jgi:rhodanese-related sulfurtransferase
MEAQIRYYENKLAFELDASDVYSALQKGEKIVVIDTRNTSKYAREHIPGAVNIPHWNINEETTQHLDKEFLYITYCDGIGCNASTQGALRLARLGFKVKEMIGGIVWWNRGGFGTEGTHSTQKKLEENWSYY